MWTFSVIFALTLAYVQATELIENDEVVMRKVSTSFSHFTLSQQWPQTNCWALNKQFPTEEITCSVCKMPKSNSRWTIHGLWPSSRSGQHPTFCDNSRKFDIRLLSSSLITQLNEKWPSFKLFTKNVELWKHEWSKHGTCALTLETKTLPKYFMVNLKLLDQFNLGPVLEKSGIVPGGKYMVQNIFQAIEKAFKVKVFVTCNKNKGEQYLGEIRLCFDKSLQLINCQSTHKSNCNGNAIIYPKALKSC